MMESRTKSLVVDASVIQSAGGTERPDPSGICSEFLEALYLIGHCVVMTPAIEAEWERHFMRFTLNWYTRVVASGRTVEPENAQNDALREEIASTNAGLDDVHLLEAALATDKIVSSLERRARNRFRDVARQVHAVGAIMWVNPTNANETPLDWLRQGCPYETPRTLGYTA